jgi:predicted ATP-grasp superfamily ATP-dependent carboligase/protein-tyrosine-phosphatase
LVLSNHKQQMNKAARRVLILDGDQGSVYAIVRSLARHGLAVDVADCIEPCLSSKSRYVDQVFQYPNPKQDPDGFVSWLEKQLGASGTGEPYAYVIPVTDDTLQPISDHRERLTPLCKIAMAPIEAHQVCSDKAQTFDLAESLGIDVPNRLLVRSIDDLKNCEWAFPIVVKPSRSVVADGAGGWHALSVRYVHNQSELETVANEDLGYGPIILQEYAQGKGVGVEVLVDHGKVVASFQHERIHEWPLTGGGSSYRKSTAVDARMLESAEQLMKACGYHGVAMVEFKHDVASDRRWLMEINGRFWGSLPLCVHAGADFPSWLFDLDVDGVQPQSTEYKTGVRSRKFSRDLFWAVEVLRRTDPNPLITWPARWQGLTTWFGVLLPNHRFDVQNFGDCKIGWFDFRRSLSLLMERFRAKRKKDELIRSMEHLRGSRQELRTRLSRTQKVLFLCYGNINRSALAEFDLAARLDSRATVEIVSAGFHDREGRSADANMMKQAAKEGIDLAASRSSRIDETMVNWADLILAMDVTHLLRLEEEFPGAMKKTILHGALSTNERSDVQILDPYGGTPEVYESCMKSVLAANSGLLDLLPDPNNS